MTPESFHNLYDAATDAPPPTNLVPPAVAAGRRRLARRRLAVTGAGVAALAVVAGSAYAGSGLTEDSPDTQVALAPGGGTSDAQIIEKCRTLPGSTKETVEAIYSVGRPTIAATTRATDRTTYVLMAKDKLVWAECSLPNAGQAGSPPLTYFWPPGFGRPGPVTTTGLRYFLAPGTSTRTAAAVGSGCAWVDGSPDPDCRTFAVRLTDRLPAAVAAVQFRTGDGKTTVVERSRNGFLTFDYVGRLPGGVPADPSAWGEFRALERVTYLNAAGDPIAAGETVVSGDPMKDKRVAGLPELLKYGSLKGNPEPGLLDDVR